ncbi:MAG: GC-type dockerin domain-anchored protein [Phycisphaerales bacterium JB058]
MHGFSRAFLFALYVGVFIGAVCPCVARAQTVECDYEDFMWSIDVGTPTSLGVLGFTVVVEGHRLYASHANGLSVVDVTSVDEPTVLASNVRFLNHAPRQMVVKDSIVFVSAVHPTRSIFALDCSDPATPNVLAQYNFGRYVHDICVEGDTLFVTDVDTQLYIFDISDLSDGMELVGEVALDLNSRAYHMAVSDGLLYVASSVGFGCYDVSNPSSPVMLGSYSSGGRPGGLVYADSYVYLVTGDAVEVVDVSVPSQPQQISILSDEIRPLDADIDGGLLSVVDAEMEVITYDISNPNDVRRLGSHRLTTNTLGVELVEGVCYIASDRQIAAVRVGRQRSDSFVSSFNIDHPNIFFLSAIVSTGDYLYAHDQDSYSWSRISLIGVVDISNPSAPTVLGVHEPQDTVWAFAANGPYGYLSSAGAGLSVVDLSDPASPTVLGNYDVQGDVENGLHRVHYDAGMIYGIYSDNLAIYDVSNPSQIAELSVLEVSSEPLIGIAKEGNLVYLIDEQLRIVVVDVSSPHSPFVIWVNEPPVADYENDPVSVSVSGGLLVFANDSRPYQFVDVTLPFLPEWFPPLRSQTHAAACVLQGERAYLYDEFLGMEIYDISSLPDLVRVGISAGQSGTHAFSLINGEYAVSGGAYGVCHVVRIGSDCSVPCLPDTNHDGVLSPADFSAWVAAFNASAPECDQNGDGSCSPADFSAWVANYNAGC